MEVHRAHHGWKALQFSEYFNCFPKHFRDNSLRKPSLSQTRTRITRTWLFQSVLHHRTLLKTHRFRKELLQETRSSIKVFHRLRNVCE